MKIFRLFASSVFALGLFTTVFVGAPYMLYHEPELPWWMKVSIFCMLGGILVVMLTLAVDQKKLKPLKDELPPPELKRRILIQNTPEVPGREIGEVLGLVQGHTIYAIWLGKDLSAMIRLMLGGELTEYTEMMGNARTIAINRMAKQAEELGADAIINTRLMTTSVVGSAAELLSYGTAVKLK
jgi:uncharacterized protein YbjQ (UPF0145 family)